MDNYQPSESLHQWSRRLMTFSHWIHRPTFSGWDNIPNRKKLLFVGNHTLFGVIDVPFLYNELYRQKGISLRSLGDRIHFRLPLWRDFLKSFGVVEGSRENCAALMQKEEPILVFPGGGREVAKRKGEKYKLLWKKRMGFARMAIEYGYTIVPFAAIGVEDMFDILIDGNDIHATPIGPLLRRLKVRDDALLPLTVGTGPLKIPNAERFYFHFAEPIETEPHKGLHEDQEICWSVREQTRKAVEATLTQLRQQQQTDPDRLFHPKLFKKAS